MHRPVRFSDDIEPLVQFVEETDPGRILEATLGKLRDGLPVKKLLTASALAVTRSSDLPPGHHGGPLHPLVGIHALHNTVERVAGEQRFLPILQHVALSNKHINHPGMGPYILADAEPLLIPRPLAFQIPTPGTHRRESPNRAATPPSQAHWRRCRRSSSASAGRAMTHTAAREDPGPGSGV